MGLGSIGALLDELKLQGLGSGVGILAEDGLEHVNKGFARSVRRDRLAADRPVRDALCAGEHADGLRIIGEGVGKIVVQRMRHLVHEAIATARQQDRAGHG